MSIFICWVLFPLVVALLSLGCGLLVRWLAGGALSGMLLLPAGLTLIVVVPAMLTYRGATAPLATPAVLVLAVAGYGTAARRRAPFLPREWLNERLRALDGFAAAAALGVFGVYAAPVVLSGHATFLGYTLLGDTSIHFVLTDWLMKHGQVVSGLPPSSYRAALEGYLGTAYPVGAHAALGSVRPLVGQDVAWIYQPFLAWFAAMASLCVYSLLGRLVVWRPWRALAAFLAAQPGLVYAYALEGSIKEIGTIWVLALVVALAAEWARLRGGLRPVIPLALATAAGITLLNVSVLPWIGPALVLALFAVLWSRGRSAWRPLSAEAGAVVVLAAVLSFPSIAVLHRFVTTVNGVLTGGGSDTGNLLQPLDPWQVLGIWPIGDFRFTLFTHTTVGFALMGLAIASAVMGVLWALRRASLWPLVLLAAAGIGALYTSARGGAWADAKALMIASPAVVMVALLGPPSLWELGRRVEALLLATAIAFGVLWTNALAYHSADLAPRDRFDELARVGSRFADQGPTLYTEFEEFAKHFLRATDPTGSNESWQNPPLATLANGAGTRFGFSTDVDELSNAYVERFRTLVLRRSGAAGRPPSNYRLVWSGHFYEVWQKQAGTVVRHLGLGTPGVQPAAPAPCPQVRALAGASARLAYVPRPPLPVLSPVKARHPRGWLPDGADPESLRPFGPGSVTGSVTVRQPGRYTVWVQGSFGRGFSVSIDGRRIGTVRHELSGRGQAIAAGSTSLTAGPHTLTLVRPGGNLYPGDGGRNRLLGPVVLDPASDMRPVQTLPSSHWRELCGRSLDWVEAVR